MLSVKSFSLKDAEGVNSLLKTARLAGGASVFVSDGQIMIPVEDGKEPNNFHKASMHSEILAKDILTLEGVRFNKTIVTHDIDELEQHRSKKEVVENKKEWEAATKKMEEIKAAELLTDAEIYRLEREIELRRERIADLLAE